MYVTQVTKWSLQEREKKEEKGIHVTVASGHRITKPLRSDAR
jgi:hypothetical protein